MLILVAELVLPPSASYPPALLWGGFALLAILLVSLPIWLVVRQAAKSREFTHLERMKALEVGRPALGTEPEDPAQKILHNAFWIAFWMGAGVPVAATAAVNSIVIQTNQHEFRILLAMWICVTIIAVASVVCATALMLRSAVRVAKTPPSPPQETHTEPTPPAKSSN